MDAFIQNEVIQNIINTITENFDVVWQYKELFIRGFFNTILLTSSGVLIGLFIGLFLGIGRLSKHALIRVPASIYVTVFRGTPLFIQVLIIHYVVIPVICEAIGKQAPEPIVSGIVALSLNSGAYIAEIFRGGIQSIDKGQTEAARSLGMTAKQTMRHIIIPQAFKRMIPPLGNEFIALLKDSSILVIIAVNELAYAGFITAKSTFVRGGPYLTVALMYLVLTLLLTALVSYLERRLKTEND